MFSFVQTLKTKGIWIVIMCCFISMFYIAHKINGAYILKPFAFIEIVSGKNSIIEVSPLEKDRQLHTTSVPGKPVLNENKYFRGFTMDIRTEKESVKSNKSSSTTTINVFKTTTGNVTTSTSIPILLNITEQNFKNETKIGILIPSSTRKIKNPILEKLSLTTICLPSIYKTLEPNYTYVIYVGVDKNDFLESVKDKLKSMFDKVKVIVSVGGTFTKTVNAIARDAYKDGMDYLVRINDDSSFDTENWTSTGISVLQNYTPPNIGVVGPTCKEGNTRILTHDMVHRTHLEIFDFYYPPYFDNWWADDWITKVYDTKRSTKMPTWVVKHHLNSHGTRYNVDLKKQVRLEKTLSFDQERLKEYLSSLQ